MEDVGDERAELETKLSELAVSSTISGIFFGH